MKNTMYNLIEFGRILLTLRKQAGYTQYKVRELTGIHHETLKHIEYGEVLPKIDTLSKLSQIYKQDLVLLLTQCRYPDEDLIDDLAIQLNHLTMLDRLEEIRNLEEPLAQARKQVKNKDNKVVNHKISQLSYLHKLVLMKNKRDLLNISQSEILALDGLRLTHPSFSINKLETTLFSLIDLRFLIFLAISKSRLDKDDQAFRILRHALSILETYPS